MNGLLVANLADIPTSGSTSIGSSLLPALACRSRERLLGSRRRLTSIEFSSTADVDHDDSDSDDDDDGDDDGD